VTDETGATVRLDDILDGQWTILHTGAPPEGSRAWTKLGVKVVRITDSSLIRWLQRKKAALVVVRPDGFIYAAVKPGKPLPTPPAIIAIRTGAST
jgi:3-(3-hydroxy-phenyl)propionate hydroxylase